MVPLDRIHKIAADEFTNSSEQALDRLLHCVCTHVHVLVLTFITKKHD
jgi:hypothetical protein